MSWVLIIFIGGAWLALLVIVAAMSRHKKSAASEIQLVGSRAQVNAELAPEGTVFIQGELWRARTVDGGTIPAHTMVQVVELRGHLLMVECQD
jgi:membrane-bound serine protease (ClpP class)